ncbi:hypothetical protein WJX84_007720 [Apatococcus fuscideae]|uniref:RNA 3'-terminal-phosphate cyclase (ATP) n=1 Tax=Apatococcus fuscideae TaxID=2026836 RepID=A0AAW1SYX1_9CHLO
MTKQEKRKGRPPQDAPATSSTAELPDGCLTVDGSMLEGGGQILRNAAALAAICSTPVKVVNIRAGRKNPGLRPQHLAGLQLVRDCCQGRLEGGWVNSTAMALLPGSTLAGSYLADTGTAGSCSLLAQAALPCLLMACVRSSQLTEQGNLTNVTISAFTAGKLQVNIAERMIETAQMCVRRAVGRDVPVDCQTNQETSRDAVGDGAGVLIVGQTDTGLLLGGTGIGERGKTSEAVAEEAAETFCSALSSGACADEWLQDQLIIFMALAQGTSKMLCQQPTLHTRTAMVVAEQMTSAHFTVTQQASSLWLIECQGAALAARQQT